MTKLSAGLWRRPARRAMPSICLACLLSPRGCQPRCPRTVSPTWNVPLGEHGELQAVGSSCKQPSAPPVPSLQSCSHHIPSPGGGC